ncbi:hypothetical protein TNCV_4437451, partial [Trichonephila clavipes]
ILHEVNLSSTTRVRFASARCTGGKDAVWSCISLALPPPTPGCEQHLPPLQNTQPTDATLDTVLSPQKWENDYSVIILPFFWAPLYAKLLWSCHTAPLVKVDSIQMRICRPFLPLPGTGGQERQRSLYPKAMWTVIGKPKLYNLVTKAWTEHTLTPGFTWLK